MVSDIEIAGASKMVDIRQIAASLGIQEDLLHLYGKYKAKLPLSLIDQVKSKPSKLILVSAISPTPAGEGKTTTSIGLTQGLNTIGKKAIAVLREPSLGHVFGMKGGATGGGYAQVLPMEDINLHFTGDFAAVEKAHNLLAAIIDNNLQNKDHTLGLDPRTVTWKRVMDMNDRALRRIIIGLGGPSMGIPRESGFDITAASEVMAILCLSENLSDLKRRLGNIFIGFTFDKRPIYARDLKAHGAMAALLKDAIMPNLVQTIGNFPAIIHGGPFANIAQGTNTVIATLMGLSLADYAVTEAGFGFDLGAEKFFDIKCQSSGLSPSAVVLVATIRAIKYHGGASKKELALPNARALKNGMENVQKHLENIKLFDIPAIVAVNKFPTDTSDEIFMVKDLCKSAGARVEISEAWAKGGEGAISLALAVAEVADNHSTRFTPLYDWNWPVEDKIKTIASKIYGASSISYTTKAKEDLKKIEQLELTKLPVCIAKTQNSLSDNPNLLGRPKDFVVTVREIEIAAGAGFVIPITGDIMRMPGLPITPAAESIDIDDEGRITGLF